MLAVQLGVFGLLPPGEPGADLLDPEYGFVDLNFRPATCSRRSRGPPAAAHASPGPVGGAVHPGGHRLRCLRPPTRRLTAKYGRTRWAARARVERGRRGHRHPDAQPLDHAGCAVSSRNAHVYIQRREVTEYRGALAMARALSSYQVLWGLPCPSSSTSAPGLATLADGDARGLRGCSCGLCSARSTAGLRWCPSPRRREVGRLRRQNALRLREPGGRGRRRDPRPE